MSVAFRSQPTRDQARRIAANWRTLAEQATRPSCGQVAPPPLDLAPPCLSGEWVQQILLRNYRSRLLIQINCTIGGASDWVLLVKCWPLPLVDDGAGALPNAPKDQKQKNARNHTDNGAAPLMGNTHSNILVEDNLHPLSATMQRG